MRRVLIVLAIVAGSVFVAAPATAEEATDGAVTTTTPTQSDTPPAPENPAPENPAPEPPAEDPPPPPAPDPDEASQTEADTQDTETPPAEKKDDSEAPPPTLKKTALAAAAAAGDSTDIKICHATKAENNPYQAVPPATASVAAGHDGHDGPIWYPGAKDDGVTWGDIIEPYTYNGVDYPGQNWTAQGEAIYNNGCKAVTEVTTEAPSVAAPTCVADGHLVLPTTTGVEYAVSPEEDGPGTYTVTATAATGYVLSGASQTSWPGLEVLPQLSAQDPQCVTPQGDVIVVPEPPVVTDPTCDAAGGFELPTVAGVLYTVLPFGMPPTGYLVIASPQPGYVFAPNVQSVWQVSFADLAQLDPDSPQCQPPDSVDVKICHATQAENNPYVVIPPATAGVANGHDDDDNGPIWYPGAKDDDVVWGDIIEPYTYNGVDYPGQNWTAEGQAIWENDCNVPDTPVDLQSMPDYLLTDRCTGDPVDQIGDDPVRIELIDVTGILSEFTVGDGQDGPWTVTWAADQGYVNTGLTDLSGDAGSAADCPTGTTPTGDDEPTAAGALPDTGGGPLWVLLMGGLLSVLGALVLSARGIVELAGLTGRASIATPALAWSYTVSQPVILPVRVAPRHRGVRKTLMQRLLHLRATLIGRRRKR